MTFFDSATLVTFSSMNTPYRLIIACLDRRGIVAAVSGFLSQQSIGIVEADHHTDQVDQWFFMRYELRVPDSFSLHAFSHAFSAIAHDFGMKWRIENANRPKSVVLMASRESHCLVDLLHRWHTQELPCEIKAVISNHPDLENIATWYQVPYHCVPIRSAYRQDDFRRMEEWWNHYNAEVIVLARFMQIVPDEICRTYMGKMINIHHSFLPSFIGAKPYHQEYERGVKLMGATCHYVTPELDKGPIIEQDVMRVSHRQTIQDMTRLGRDVEKAVLARGLSYHLNDRVLIHGNKTVIL